MMLPPDGAHLDRGSRTKPAVSRCRGSFGPSHLRRDESAPTFEPSPDPAWTAGGTSVTVEPAVGDADRAVDGAQHVGVVRRDHAGAADYDRVGERASTAAAQPASW